MNEPSEDADYEPKLSDYLFIVDIPYMNLKCNIPVYLNMNL